MNLLPLHKVIILALAVVVIIIAGGFGYYLVQQGGNLEWTGLSFPWTKKVVPASSSNINAANVNAGIGQTPAQAADSANMKEAITRRDSFFCDKIGDESKRDLCYIYVINGLAIAAKDGSKCDEIKSEFYKNDCHDNFTIYLARQDNDKAKCGDLINKQRVSFCESSFQ